MVTLPRFVVSAPASGQGKTTLAIGLMTALRDRGVVVAPAKVGPDYIDPGYHELACGRPSRNLDPVLVGAERMVPLLLRGAATPTPADVAVVEGVMGLYDGRLGTRGFGSTGHVAALTASPVLVCVDVRHTSRTVGAIVHGLASYDPRVRIGGAVLNHAGSSRQVTEATCAIEEAGVPVLGALPRLADIVTPSRHLGLVPVQEREESRSQLARLGAYVAEHVDLDRVLALARSAPPLTGAPWDPRAELDAVGAAPAPPEAPSSGSRPPRRPVVAVAGGRAFTFRYAETQELLEAAGCEVVGFDPLTDEALPEGTAGLYLGGGFPQVHASELASNDRLRAAIRASVAAGLPTVAECAGLLYLCERLDDAAMVGALPLTAAMTPRLTLGYREASAASDTLLARTGERVSGHEFHRTRTQPLASDVPGSDPAANGACPPDRAGAVRPAWMLGDLPDGISADPSGRGRPTLHASYLHVHWAGSPHLARRFADAVRAHADTDTVREPGATAPPAAPLPGDPGSGEQSIHRDRNGDRHVQSPSGVLGDSAPEHHGDRDVDLHHHGDRDLAPGLVDLAVNVRPARTPAFLLDAVSSGADWSAYPDARGVPELVAAHHGVPADHVLLTAGAAEAFLLLARALHAICPLVVHPQFTEPEAALRAAGHRPRRHVLAPADGFRLDPAAVSDVADLVLLGNPTNPTSVLHPAAAIEHVRRAGPPGRVVVVDEAFMDAVPGERESMIGPDMERLLVLRSLTKTWGIAGLRAGYVVGDPVLLARLVQQQQPWPVSTPALQAVVACLTPQAVALARHDAGSLGADRADLLERLGAVGVQVVEPAEAPFVLVDTAPLAPVSLRPALAERGFAVRRGETFPGLGPTWIRVAVRTPDVHARLADALTAIAPQTRGSFPSL